MLEEGFQYDDPAHQADTAMSGMWLFLATEILFFGGLVFVWLMLHRAHPGGFALATGHTNLWIGTANTALLITSSAVLTWGVLQAQAGQEREAQRRRVAWACAGTAALGLAFVALKGVEWALDFGEHLFPGPGFALTGPDAGGAQMFFAFYFIATAVHALHMLAGIVLLGWIARRALNGDFRGGRGTPVEVAGLYWSFVDLVWLTLFPLLYLIARP